MAIVKKMEFKEKMTSYYDVRDFVWKVKAEKIDCAEITYDRREDLANLGEGIIDALEPEIGETKKDYSFEHSLDKEMKIGTIRICHVPMTDRTERRLDNPRTDEDWKEEETSLTGLE